MCDICIPILGKNARSHSNNSCILAKSLYCNLCSVYGHTHTTCKKSNLKKFRETDGHLREEKLEYESDNNRIYISDSEKAFSAMLIANKIVPMACQEKGRLDERDYNENKGRLVKLLKSVGKELVVVSIPWCKAEDEQLRNLIKNYKTDNAKFTNNDWKAIASEMERRTHEHCKSRWLTLSNAKINTNN